MAAALPPEMISEILCHLPVKSLLRFKCVSKSWRALISDSFFINQHLNRSKSTPRNRHEIVLQFSFTRHRLELASFGGGQALKLDSSVSMDDIFNVNRSKTQSYIIMGSCDGLLCVALYRYETRPRESLWLYNMSTRRHKRLPPAIIPIVPDDFRDDSSKLCGLGYNATSRDYEVIKIQIFRSIDRVNTCGKAIVYSLAKNSWRSINFPQTFAWQGMSFGGKLVNGAFHWVTKHGSARLHDIIAYDFATENFSEVPLPDYAHNINPTYYVKIVELAGCLGLLFHSIDSYEGWMMKDYGVKKSWTRLFNIRQDAVNLFSGNNCECFAGNIFITPAGDVLLWDTENKSVERLELKYIDFAASHVENLVALC